MRVTEGEGGMLRRLSLFIGGCTLRAAAAISGAADSFPDPRSDEPAGGPTTQQEMRVMDVLARLNSLSLLTVLFWLLVRVVLLPVTGSFGESVAISLSFTSSFKPSALAFLNSASALADNCLPRSTSSLFLD